MRFILSKKTMAIALGAVMAAWTMPASAQDKASGADIDALIDASATPDGALTLARGQAGAGDLTGAAATLERALLDAPLQRTVAVRLYYIAILCRLDDHERARVEVARLGGLRVDGPGWSEAQAACGALPVPPSAPGARGGITARVGAGVAYDTDTLGALATQFDFGTPPVREGGFSFIASLDVNARIPWDSGFFYGGVNAVSKDALSGPDLDYQVGTLRFGYGQQLGNVELSAGPVGSFARLDGASFFGELGGQGEIAMLASQGRVALKGEIVHQSYYDSFFPVSRNGTRYDLALEWQGQPRTGLTYVVGGAFEYKTAATAPLGYTGGRLYAAARLPLAPGGTYADLSGTVRHFAYRDDAGFRQIETRYFARAAIGTPLIAGIDIEAAASYTRRDYNKASLLQDYDDVGGELRLVWTFGG